MASIVVRPAQNEDLEGYFDVRSLTYNDGNPVPEEKRNFPHSRPFVGLVDGEVNGVFNVLGLTCTRGPAVLPCGGVASVAVYPHRRKSGIGSEMMAWVPRHLRQEGIPISSLYAFREPFYRKAGYEVVGKRLKIICPTDRFPRVKPKLAIRRLRPEDWTLLDSCYTEFATARSGFSLRTEKLWRRVLAENRPLTIYAAGDPVQAYAVVSHATSFWTTDHMSDVAWSSAEGYEALLDLFAGLSINKGGLSWFEPSDSPFYARYLDQGVETKLERPVMYRICDVPRAIRSMASEEAGVFTLRVHDHVIPENEGPWRIAFEPGQVSVERCDVADLEMDILAFAQVFLGDPSLLDLVRIGRIKAASSSSLRTAARLFTALPVTCNDFF